MAHHYHQTGHQTVELQYICPKGCKMSLNIDKDISELLQTMWQKNIHTHYSCQGDDTHCNIRMTVNEFKKFMLMIAYVEDYTNQEQYDWYQNVISYKCQYKIADYLNVPLFDFSDNDDIKQCQLQIEIDVTVYIPVKDVPIIIKKLQNYKKSDKINKIHNHTLDDGNSFIVDSV